MASRAREKIVQIPLFFPLPRQRRAALAAIQVRGQTAITTLNLLSSGCILAGEPATGGARVYNPPPAVPSESRLESGAAAAAQAARGHTTQRRGTRGDHVVFKLSRSLESLPTLALRPRRPVPRTRRPLNLIAETKSHKLKLSS